MAEYSSLVLWFLSVMLMALASVPLFLERNSSRTCAAVLLPIVAYLFPVSALNSLSYSAFLIPSLISGAVLSAGTALDRRGLSQKSSLKVWGILIVFLLAVLSLVPLFGEASGTLSRTVLFGLNTGEPSVNSPELFGQGHVLAVAFSLLVVLFLFVVFPGNIQSVFSAFICGLSIALSLPVLGGIGSFAVTLLVPYLVCIRFGRPFGIIWATATLSLVVSLLAVSGSWVLTISSGTVVAVCLPCVLLFSSSREAT